MNKDFNIQLIIVACFVSILGVSCIGRGTEERRELTEKYGLAIESAYKQYMLATVKACQTKDIEGLDEFAEGSYLELLEKRVEDSECYPTELVEEEIVAVTIESYSSGEIEALIRVQSRGEQYYWLCTFREDNGTWKITSISVPPWS